MENWTDKAIRQHIEDVIEESYLLSLSEPEIRQYLRNFLMSCESVLSSNISVHSDIRLTKVKITLLRSYLLLHESTSRIRTLKRKNEGDSSTYVENLVHNVVRIKSSILRLLDHINPSLSVMVLERCADRSHTRTPQEEKNIRFRAVMREAAYYCLLTVVIFVLVTVIMW